MSLYLNATARSHLIAAQQALLAPLAYEDAEAWMLAVNGHLLRLLGADHTIAFILDERGIDFISDDTETELLNPLRDRFLGYDEAGYATFEPVDGEPAGSLFVERMHRVRRSHGGGAGLDVLIDCAHSMKRAEIFQSTHIPAGMCFMAGLGTSLPVGEVTTCVAFERSDAKGYSEEGLRKLQLLVPAYEAGVRAWRRMAGYQNMLDLLQEALAVFGPEGRTLFQSQALVRLLSDNPKAGEVILGMKEVAHRLHRWRPRRSRKAEAKAKPTVREVTTKGGSYRIWGSPLQPQLFGTEAVLVTVERQDPALPPSEQLQARFGLTPREAEVALLLAEGLDNRAVAERLYISPHTARRHTEKVLHKLGIASRTAVAITLLRQPSLDPPHGLSTDSQPF